MRIAVFENLPPGGAKRAAYEFGRYLAPRHAVDLYQLSTTSTRAFDLGPLVHAVYRYRYAPLFGLLDQRLAQGHLAPRSVTLFRPLRAVHRRIAADLGRRGYDVVLAHTDAMTQSPYLLRWLPAGLGIYYCQEPLRVVREREVLRAHRRNLSRSRPPLGALRVLEDRWVLARLSRGDRATVSLVSQILVNSEHSRREVSSAYGREATVCYLGVDPDVFSPSRDGARDHEVLSVGAPVTAKGNELIIQALATLPATVRPRLRIMAGSSIGVDALRARAKAVGVVVEFESSVSDALLAAHYQRAIACIGASRMEPFGLTALEAMACGTPVIAIREGGYRETVVDGETGLLVDPTPESMGAAIGRLAASPTDVRQFGGRGRAQVLHQWTWAQSGARLEAILHGVLESRQGVGRRGPARSDKHQGSPPSRHPR